MSFKTALTTVSQTAQAISRIPHHVSERAKDARTTVQVLRAKDFAEAQIHIAKRVGDTITTGSGAHQGLMAHASHDQHPAFGFIAEKFISKELAERFGGPDYHLSAESTRRNYFSRNAHSHGEIAEKADAPSRLLPPDATRPPALTES